MSMSNLPEWLHLSKLILSCQHLRSYVGALVAVVPSLLLTELYHFENGE